MKIFLRAITGWLVAFVAPSLFTGCSTTPPTPSATAVGSYHWSLVAKEEDKDTTEKSKAKYVEYGYFSRVARHKSKPGEKTTAVTAPLPLPQAVYWTLRRRPGQAAADGIFTGCWYHQKSEHDSEMVCEPLGEQLSQERFLKLPADTDVEESLTFTNITHPPGGARVEWGCTYHITHPPG